MFPVFQIYTKILQSAAAVEVFALPTITYFIKRKYKKGVLPVRPDFIVGRESGMAFPTPH